MVVHFGLRVGEAIEGLPVWGNNPGGDEFDFYIHMEPLFNLFQNREDCPRLSTVRSDIRSDDLIVPKGGKAAMYNWWKKALEKFKALGIEFFGVDHQTFGFIPMSSVLNEAMKNYPTEVQWNSYRNSETY